MGPTHNVTWDHVFFIVLSKSPDLGYPSQGRDDRVVISYLSDYHYEDGTSNYDYQENHKLPQNVFKHVGFFYVLDMQTEEIVGIILAVLVVFALTLCGIVFCIRLVNFSL